MREAPTTGDVAAALDASQRVVQRVVSDLRREGVLVAVGRADRPGLAVADSTPPTVRRLRALIERVKARHAAEMADELAELEALEREMAVTAGVLVTA
jgi:hypothetical protein